MDVRVVSGLGGGLGLARLLAVARRRAVRGDRGAELLAQGVEVGEGVVAADLEVGDDRLDLGATRSPSSIVARAWALAASAT